MVDRWRKLDLFALQICLIAFVIRLVDVDSSWGPGLYAMSTPLLFWRLLYYAQVFKFQGAMVQVGGPVPIQTKITHTCINRALAYATAEYILWGSSSHVKRFVCVPAPRCEYRVKIYAVGAYK